MISSLYLNVEKNVDSTIKSGQLKQWSKFMRVQLFTREQMEKFKKKRSQKNPKKADRTIYVRLIQVFSQPIVEIWTTQAQR